MKAMLRRVVAESEATDERDFSICLHETLSTKNSMGRVNGYSPSQWVLGKNPRCPGSVTHLEQAANLGVLEDSLDPSARFHLNHPARMAATYQHLVVHTDH
jgi:hypothetical protein